MGEALSASRVLLDWFSQHAPWACVEAMDSKRHLCTSAGAKNGTSQNAGAPPSTSGKSRNPHCLGTWRAAIGAGFTRMVERAAVTADLGIKAHAHMLRHACGHKLANDGHDTRAIQAYLGHRNIQNTTRIRPWRRSGFEVDPGVGQRATAVYMRQWCLPTAKYC
jgi:hypothetical protein